MFKHILVPLDGSKLAESSLSAAAYLVNSGGSEVTLLHVVEDRAPMAVHGERHLTSPAGAEAYLRTVSERFFAPETKVNHHVHDARITNVAREIADHQEEIDHDLIVMCTHGRSGANTLVFGSIAQKIVSLGTVPVLIVQPDPPDMRPSRPFSPSPMLIPLDGTPEHWASVAIANDFAEETHSEVHLLLVVPTWWTLPGKWEDTTKILPTSADRLLEMAAEEAGEYLERQRSELTRRGIAVSAEIDRGDPAKVISESAEKNNARLLVLSTHGKSGLSALWEGNVASRVLSRINLPVLLVPVRESDRQKE
jgi:nucleotide-binding universal stress UspA family protein